MDTRRPGEPANNPNDSATPSGSSGRLPVRNAPIAHARAVYIYLKHRGVLNVEEYRRTNARSR